MHAYVHPYIHTHTYTYTHTYIHTFIHGVTLQKTAVHKSHITQFRLQPSPITSASHFNIMAPSIRMGPTVFPTHILYIFRISSMRATYLAQLILPDFIIQRNSFILFKEPCNAFVMKWLHWQLKAQFIIPILLLRVTHNLQAIMVQDVRDARKSGNLLLLLIGLKRLDKTATFRQESRNGERRPIT